MKMLILSLLLLSNLAFAQSNQLPAPAEDLENVCQIGTNGVFQNGKGEACQPQQYQMQQQTFLGYPYYYQQNPFGNAYGTSAFGHHSQIVCVKAHLTDDTIQCPDGIYKKDTSSDNSERSVGEKSNLQTQPRIVPTGNNSGSVAPR